MYSLLPLLYFFLSVTLLLLSSCWREGVRSALPGLRGLLGVRLPVDVPVAPCFREFLVYVLRFRCIGHFVINVINNICISFIISFYVICAVIYCSFCCIYVWLDPCMYMIARFMSFYKPGVTEWYQSRIDVGQSLDRTGRVLGLLSNPCLLKLFCYYTPWILWLLPVLPWSLSKE